MDTTYTRVITVRCIHQGIEKKKEGWQPFCFAECVDIKLEEVVQLIYHLKYTYIQRVL